MSRDNASVSLRETLHYLVKSDIPAGYKRVLIETVAHALRAENSQEEQGDPARRESPQEWQPSEVSIAVDFLQGKVAHNWQHADETVMRLAGELRRDPDDIRKKAAELGFGLGVDYRLVKNQLPSED